ncbi:MAG: SDR family oxidoreductase [Saprospiraceae bacterium]|nr:SDR family oxidoreductase [Bacteroidia bacterium]NNE13831.1 SDR family oxidoreductase [Saprospiraceae bacterium]NNL93390.1 SDR family oxidoreductase [Saprospiraceae bacterium]
MELHLKDKLFVVTGATSGIGHSIARSLIKEGAKVIVNARGEEKLSAFKNEFHDQIEIHQGDITTDATISSLIMKIGKRHLDGIVFNAGGPPPKSFNETKLQDWDNAYDSLLRWKVKLSKEFIPLLKTNNYGRMLFIESVSVKQPIDNLILSNSLRLAVVGFVKTLSSEVADSGITVNILAPGYHSTPRMEQLFKKKAMLLGISPQEAKLEFEKEILVGKMGDTDDLASLATWLLSPHSRYITGQTINVDGGLAKGSL